jgi:hypothetical protein
MKRTVFLDNADNAPILAPTPQGKAFLLYLPDPIYSARNSTKVTFTVFALCPSATRTILACSSD